MRVKPLQLSELQRTFPFGTDAAKSAVTAPCVAALKLITETQKRETAEEKSPPPHNNKLPYSCAFAGVRHSFGRPRQREVRQEQTE